MFPKFKVKNLQAIVANYFTCFITGSLIIGENPVHPGILHTSWLPYALFLSFLFITFFNVGAFAIQKIGMIITSIFQKLSLIFPVLMGILLFGEILNVTKSVAIISALIAIVLVNIPNKSIEGEISHLRQYWYLPFLVLLGNGSIETTLFFVEEKGIVSGASLNFVTTLFFLAGLWGVIYMIIARKAFFTNRDIIAGICLGIPNFFTIYLLIKALEIGWDGSVLFPVNNVSVLSLTAVVGFIFFKERLNKYNVVGLILAIAAVLLISS
ncbi:MAG: EamA family transporter [Saprospiraceae bacterium]|nr:EamA family transporter [Saprospiraceae bacterium]